MRRLIAAAGGLVCALGIAAASAGAPVIAATPPMPSVMPLAPSGSSHSARPAPTAVLTPESASGSTVAAVLPTPTAGQVAPAIVTPTPQPEALPAATEAPVPTETTAPTPPTAPAPPAAPVCVDASQLVPLLDDSDVQAVDQATGLPMWLLDDDSGTVVLGDACPMPTPQPPAVPVQVP